LSHRSAARGVPHILDDVSRVDSHLACNKAVNGTDSWIRSFAKVRMVSIVL
jgi:hypothetical protein